MHFEFVRIRFQPRIRALLYFFGHLPTSVKMPVRLWLCLLIWCVVWKGLVVRPFTALCFVVCFSIVERADKIARELDTSENGGLDRVRGYKRQLQPRVPRVRFARFVLSVRQFDGLCNWR